MIEQGLYYPDGEFRSRKEIMEAALARDGGMIVDFQTRPAVEQVYRESLQKPVFEKHLLTSDYHLPDMNPVAYKLLRSFIADFKPDKFHIVGDFLNFTTVSKYDKDPHYHVSLKDEIEQGRAVLGEMTKDLRIANPKCQILWYEGNHERRLYKYLARNAAELAELEIDDEEIISIPYLFQLDEQNITWVPQEATHVESGNVIIEHGEIARKASGYTAKAMHETRGQSGMSGHTHRQAVHMWTVANETHYWFELGSMCNLQPTPGYVKRPDWQNGFAVGIYSYDTKLMYPTAIPILNNSFVFNEKMYV